MGCNMVGVMFWFAVLVRCAQLPKANNGAPSEERRTTLGDGNRASVHHIRVADGFVSVSRYCFLLLKSANRIEL